MPGKSFAAHLVEQGFDVFVIDWGTPGPEDRYLSFEDVCDRYLGRALRRTAATSERGQAHVLGYCLGGTLAAIHVARHPERAASLLALAAPVAFDDDGLLAHWTRAPNFDVQALSDGCGNVPWPLMQWAFHMLRPTLALSKGVHLVDRAWDDRFLDGFLALETWGNDNVSFPGAAYRTYVEELCRADALVRGTFAMSGQRVQLSDIRCPVLAVTFEHDTIVPSPSAAALLDHVASDDTQRIHLPGGHVGAVVSRAAKQHLWPQLTAWWAARDDHGGACRHAPSMPPSSHGEPPGEERPRRVARAPAAARPATGAHAAGRGPRGGPS